MCDDYPDVSVLDEPHRPIRKDSLRRINRAADDLVQCEIRLVQAARQVIEADEKLERAVARARHRKDG